MLVYGKRCVEANGKAVVRRYLSSNPNLSKTASEVVDRPPSQPFVKTRIEPGEWDPKHTNPLYRPKFRSSAKIISSDDFANRPSVGLSDEFESFQDAMVTISWLDQNDHKLVYQLYLDLMVSAESSSGGRTSHEYVMRVIAQKFNITADRVAAIVQLQHNEQQMILENPDIELCTELADEMDRGFKAEIDEAYQTFNLKKPESFVEDPAGATDLKPNKQWVIAADVFDVDQMSEDAVTREDSDARLIIDGHVYIEDVDKELIPVPLDKDCRSLLKQRGTIDKKMSEENARVLSERDKKAAIEPPWRKTNGEGVTRERYKFIAQTVNIRQLKKARMKHRSYINNNVANTLVEHNGEIRPGNMADMASVSWKAIRNDHEHAFEGVKQGWLDRMNRNATKSWGRAPPRIPRLQQPIPLPPVETPTLAAGALDDVVADAENAADIATSSDDVIAANINDNETSAAAVVQTLPESSEMSPDDPIASQETTTVASIDSSVDTAEDAKSDKSAEIPNVETLSAQDTDVIEATNIDDSNNNNTGSLESAAVDTSTMPTSEMPSTDHDHATEPSATDTSDTGEPSDVKEENSSSSALEKEDSSDSNGKSPI